MFFLVCFEEFRFLNEKTMSVLCTAVLKMMDVSIVMTIKQSLWKNSGIFERTRRKTSRSFSYYTSLRMPRKLFKIFNNKKGIDEMRNTFHSIHVASIPIGSFYYFPRARSMIINFIVNEAHNFPIPALAESFSEAKTEKSSQLN